MADIEDGEGQVDFSNFFNHMDDGGELSPEEQLEILEEQQEEMEDALESERRRASRLKSTVEEQKSTIHTYEKRFDQMKDPPMMSGYLLEVYDDTKALVSMGDTIMLVGHDGDTVDKEDELNMVFLHPKSKAIMDVDRSKRYGASVGEVVETLDNIDGLYTHLVRREGMSDYVEEIATEEELAVGQRIEYRAEIGKVYRELASKEQTEFHRAEYPRETYDDIGGLDVQIDRIQEKLLQDRDIAALFNRKPNGGILLWGPPGTGKTLIAKATANEYDMAFFNVSVADILSKWVGESERQMQRLFEEAAEKATEVDEDGNRVRQGSIVFFDEIDALATKRGQQDTAGVHKNIIAQMLSQMDGVEERKDVYIMGATNRPDMIDPALQRPGRFSEVLQVPRPTREAGEHILDIYLEDVPLHEDVLAVYNEDRGAAYAGVKEKILDELYGENKYLEYDDRDGSLKESNVKRKDVVSGALISEIVEELGVRAEKRFKETDVYEEAKEQGYDVAEAFLEYGEGIHIDDIEEIVRRETSEHALVESGVIEQREKEASRQSDDQPQYM